MAHTVRACARALLAVAAVCVLAVPMPVAGATSGVSSDLHADLDGRAIALAEVGKYYCEDFTAPAIHCYSKAASLQASVTTFAATATNYVIVYEFSGYAGAYMYMSQDYTVLATIGWNDRISSYIALNGEYGHFYTDWFYGGTLFGFCCNQYVPGLGAYDNTYSSVHRL